MTTTVIIIIIITDVNSRRNDETGRLEVGNNKDEKASDLDTDIQSTTTQTQCADALSYIIIIKTSKQQDRRQESRIKLQP